MYIKLEIYLKLHYLPTSFCLDVTEITWKSVGVYLIHHLNVDISNTFFYVDIRNIISFLQ